MIDANRIKAARALLEWSQADLAANSSVSLPTIRRMESKGIDSCYHRSVASVENTLAKAGIIFPDKMTIKILEPYQNKKELQKHLKERAEKNVSLDVKFQILGAQAGAKQKTPRA